MKIITLLLVCGILAFSSLATDTAVAKPPKKEDPPKKDEGPALPADLNKASLRVAALDSLYELDLSIDQLKVLRGACMGAATTRPMVPAKGNAKLKEALQELQGAILEGKDDQRIATARNDMVDAVNGDEVELHDEVQATSVSRAKAPIFFREIKAGQIAAYLAVHADQIADPVERMINSLAEIRGDDSDPTPEIEQVSDEVGTMVAGLDDDKVKVVADKVTAFLKSAQAMKDDEFASRQTALEEGAKKIVGDVSSMDILSHWFENDIAGLMANPQLPAAIEMLIAAREQTH